MAEGSAERKVRMYRSVSFKRLENWNAKGFVLEGGTKLPGERDVTQPTCQKAHRPSRSLSLSRKVSKISAASKDQTSPSVRQLSQRFSSQPRDEGAQCGEENPHLNKECQEEQTLDLPCHQDQHGQDPLTVTVCDGSGKSDDLLAYVNPRASKSSGTLLDELTLNSYYSLLNQPENREIIGFEGNWPSVTEMRKLFGENSRKPNVRASSLPDYDEPRLSNQQFSYLRDATDSHRPCPVESAFPKGFNHCAADLRPKHPTLKIENSHSRNLVDSKPDINSILCMDTKDHRTNSGPKPQPPTPPPRSCIPFGLKAHTLSSGVPKQEARQQSVSLHSLHSSGKPQTAPSNVRLRFSSSEEELHSKALQLPSSPNKNEFQDRSQEVSSGSEEESNRVTLRESLRNRSFRKKKRDLEEGKSDLSGESNAKHVISDEVGQDANHSGYPLHGANIYETTSASPVSAGKMGVNAAANKPSPNLSRGISNEFPRQHLRGISEGLSPSTACHLSAASPMPTVSRVAKVNIPPFLPSPCGSRSSSRYSSTETLKEDDPFNAYSSGQSRQGGFNIYRSPSFGHNDNVRQQARSRLRVAPNVTKLKSENVHEVSSCDPESENSKYTKSMSNPDIASETLNLLSFLKSDISDLKIRNRIRECTDGDGVTARNESTHGSGSQETWVSKGRSASQSMSNSQQGNRPTLKDLTATLRRTKSFTYSEKLGSRRRVGHGSMKQSSSELSLASTGDEALLSNSKANEDGAKQGEDAASALSQDQYIQEARQVFEKISQIGSQDDYSFDQEVSTHIENKMAKGLPLDCTSHSLEKKSNTFIEKLEENMSLEELSHHEFSMTDEGIVTEVETTSGDTLYQDLGQTLTVWKSADKIQGEAHPFTVHNGEIQQSPSAVKTSFEIDSCCDVVANTCSSQVPLDTPPTPGTMRRRRKFPSLRNTGSDSSNGSSGESGSETYRSLSDPMPHRTYSITEDSKAFSVDSNLLGSLNSKTGNSESSTIAFSECTGSAASVLSFSSDGVKDYNTVIQNIVSQPGALDKVIDEKGNGKTIKKKSFSDPSRRGELSPTGLENSTEPINELSSSSEPILTEQRDESGEVEDAEEVVGRVRSQSECVLPHAEDDSGVEGNQNFSFDPKLAEVLSPRTLRRSSKKRTNRVGSQDGQQECNKPTEALGKSRVSSKHVRHTSEPSTFIPIVSAESKSSSHPVVKLTIPESAKLPVKPLPSLICPQLEDVSKKGTRVTGDNNTPSVGDLPRTAPSTPTTAEPKLLRLHKPHEDLTPGNRSKPYVDMRKHVFLTLLDTEHSYVESLRTLMESYMKPLKLPENSFLCDPSLVDEIFDQIPELLEHHEQFLEQVNQCVQNWGEIQTVGDVLVQSFSKEILVSIYSAYIDNFLNAKDAVRAAKEARPAFIKFLEQCTRENKEKQALSDLMIKPVQRIPRYELIVKDLLKHTPEDHPDHLCLIDAQINIKQLAERINRGMRSAEETERDIRILQEIESHIEGMEDLQAPFRRFVRQEMVVEVKAVGGKKERSLFLFTDLLICTTLKRKSGSLRRSSMSLYTAASVIDISSKYKLLWKLPLEDVDIVKGTSQASNRDSVQKIISRLDEDLSTMGQISKLSETLSFPHQSLDDVIKDMMASVHRELAEKQSLSFTMSFPPNKVELTTTKADGTESFIFEFSNPEARLHFEQGFEETKKKLVSSKNRLDPEFLKAIPIMKTRSGMQFSCASPSHSCLENVHEVWVCNSDGYVGQVCLLSIKNEPSVEACIAVCSARILCVASVPGLKKNHRDRPVAMGSQSSETQSQSQEETVSQQCLHISISGSSLELSETTDSASRDLVPFDSDDTDDESSPSPSGTLQSQASRSTISSSFAEEMPSAKDTTTETTSSEEEQETNFIPGAFNQNRDNESPTEGQPLRRSSRSSFTRGSLEDLLSLDPEAYHSSMWLGTEDGCIHIYQSSDNIRNRKNSMKMQHSAAVMCILYLDNQVFVSLANGELIVYQREAGSFWDPQNSKSLPLGSPGGPVTKMVSVSGKLWCGCQNRVTVFNTSSLLQEHCFLIGQDQNRSVTCMVSSSAGMWISLQGSAQVRLYHSTSFEQLAEVDIAPPVHKMLAGSDAIIRQHKSACLRITALLACKDLLWIGTSAGVLLTLSFASTTSNSLKGQLSPVGLSQGHTGHVRFLTSVELPEGFDVLFPLSDQGNDQTSELERRDPARYHRPSPMTPPKSKILVISGGDGYEDFRLTSSSETVGRDDSTNHLLLWRV